MRPVRFTEAIDAAIADAMIDDERVLLFGEDVQVFHAPLFTRFGARRVLDAPISEAGFVGAAVGAAMAGLRPVVEVMLVDFVAVAMNAVLNEMAKIEALSGGGWTVPLVLRATCGGGYGDGGQHEQALWGMLAAIPGLVVAVPSTPADGYGLMATALAHDGPVVLLEHKLLSERWLEWMGRGGRETVTFDVPVAGTEGELPEHPERVSFGRAAVRREGDDLTLVSLGVGAHRAVEAAEVLAAEGLSAEVLDLRTVRPLDVDAVRASVARTGRVVVVDEDYTRFGLTGEIAATLLEAGQRPAFARVGVDATLPYARHLEEQALPNVPRILAAARALAE